MQPKSANKCERQTSIRSTFIAGVQWLEAPRPCAERGFDDLQNDGDGAAGCFVGLSNYRLKLSARGRSTRAWRWFSRAAA